jgi:hypothetical protein
MLPSVRTSGSGVRSSSKRSAAKAPVAPRSVARTSPTASACREMARAEAKSPAPTARATRAVFPTDRPLKATSESCATWLPAPTAATAGGPSRPTIIRLAMPRNVTETFSTRLGQARCIMARPTGKLGARARAGLDCWRTAFTGVEAGHAPAHRGSRRAGGARQGRLRYSPPACVPDAHRLRG